MQYTSFLWLDLVSDGTILPEWQDNVVILQALPLILPEPLSVEDSKKQITSYLQQLKEADLLYYEENENQGVDY